MILATLHQNPIFWMARTGSAERDSKRFSFTLNLLLPVKWPHMHLRFYSVPESAMQRSWMPGEFPDL